MEECVILGLKSKAGKILTESIERLNTGTHSKLDLTYLLETLEKFMKFSQMHGDIDLLSYAPIQKILTESIERLNAGTRSGVDLT